MKSSTRLRRKYRESGRIHDSGLAPGTTVLTVSYVKNETIFDKVTIEVIGRPRVKFTRESIV